VTGGEQVIDSYGPDGLGVDWDCDHCGKEQATDLDSVPAGWLVDDDADIALCAACRTTSVLAMDPETDRRSLHSIVFDREAQS
jgi:hypothetical protein